MKKQALKIFIIDLFFIVSSFIGVGFATGKELERFFIKSKFVLLSIAIFFVVFTAFCIFILKAKQKYSVTSFSALNKIAFGKHYKTLDLFLAIFFVITSSAMLAGCDNIMKNVFEIRMPIFSFFLSVITFFIIIGGIRRIKLISNCLVPILLGAILINVFYNFTPTNLPRQSLGVSIIFPIVFCSENCITLISVLLKTKSKKTPLALCAGGIIGLIILFAVFAIFNATGYDMPLLSLSKNLGNIFFIIYLICVLFALFITLQICSYSCFEIYARPKNKYFIISLILLVQQSISYLGFTFIVEYLYFLMGILGLAYLILLTIRLIILNKK